VELDQRESVLQICKPPLRRHVGVTETLAAPLGARVLQKLRAAPFHPRVRYIAQLGMKLLDQALLTEARFADDRYQLPIALPCALPAPH
jgi:hypothetical protein